VTNASARKRRLESLIAQYNLSNKQVGDLVGRSAKYVADWRSGRFEMAPEMLRLLELEISHGGGVERVQMNAAMQG
jgi:hypothetical protein